jgi:hypothetical protein
MFSFHSKVKHLRNELFLAVIRDIDSKILGTIFMSDFLILSLFLLIITKYFFYFGVYIYIIYYYFTSR